MPRAISGSCQSRCQFCGDSSGYIKGKCLKFIPNIPFTLTQVHYVEILQESASGLREIGEKNKLDWVNQGKCWERLAPYVDCEVNV